MWDIKQKATKEQQEKQTKNLIDTGNSTVVTRGKWWREGEGVTEGD